MLERSDLTKSREINELLKFLFDYARSLGEDVSVKPNELVHDIIAYESWLGDKACTPHVCDDFKRDEKWAAGWKRLLLHSKIIKSLMTKKRPDDEDKITIESGGALPLSGIKRENKAFIVSGPPASGKSYLSKPLAAKTGSIIVDPDDIKRMLPEYRNGLNASGLHEESSMLTKGPNGVLDCAASMGANIVYPVLGCSEENLIEMRKRLMTSGYTSVYLVTIHCPIEIAAVRSLIRMKTTGRYVPLSHILAAVGDLPLQAYKKAKRSPGWKGHALFHASFDRKPPSLLEKKNFDSYANLFDN